MRFNNYLDRQEIVKVNLNNIYVLAMEQCTEYLQSTLKRDQIFERKSKGFYVLWLLR